MGLSFVRTIILYLCVITAMRLMGKRTIGEMNPTELVVSIMISDLATVPMQSKSTPLFDGIIPIFTLVFMELVLAFAILKSRRIRRILVGRSCRIVKNGKLLEREMANLRVTVDDLEEQLRSAGYTDISQVSEVIVETDGQVSIIPKEKNRPVELGDINLEAEQSLTPYIVIVDGKIREKEMKNAGIDEKFIEKALRENGIGKIKDVLYLSVSNSKIVNIQRKERSDR